VSENTTKTMVVLATGAAILSFLLLARPQYLASYSMLAIFIGAELLLAALVKYRKAFFVVLISVFLLAGAHTSVQRAFLQGRWVVLGVGAVAGLAIYITDGHHHFSGFHLLAFFCVLAAAVSASVSSYPEEAGLKAASLLLLFLYAATGARLAVPRFNPEIFFRKLLIACECLVWITAVLYLLLRVEILGNPNSLGAVMGVAVVPMLLWGMLTAPTQNRRTALGVELAVAVLLLMSSFARAGIGAAIVASVLLCLSLRRYRSLIKGLIASIVIATAVIMFVPHSLRGPEIDSSQSIESAFLYKGKTSSGVFGSRRSVWLQTWDSIRQSPWFGTGFGTSLISGDLTRLSYGRQHFDSWVDREHGNSYLAIAEWTGLLGVLPFYLLLMFTVMKVGSVFRWLRRTGDVFAPCVPAAAIVAAGLVHAIFEDWMFAVGYYLCVFFWAIAFIMIDVIPRASVVYAPEMFAPVPVSYAGAAASGQ
jgi:O-antigen ligase